MLSKRQVVINGGVFGLFILLGIGIYLNSLHNGFHYDDSHHITGNSYIQNLKNIPLFFKEPRTFSVFSGAFFHYRPLVLVSHALNFYFGELNPVGYHLVNLGFHIGSAYLVFLIIRRMMGEGISLFPPVAAGLLFLTTPFNSEVVNYISARSTVMCAFFYLLSFYCWVRYREVAAGFSLRDQGGIPRNLEVAATPYYIASLLAFVLAMLTKEMAITLPAMLFLYDLYFKKVSIKTIYRCIPFVTIGVFVGFISRLIFFGAFNPIKGKKVEEGFYFIIKSKVLVKYFYDIILPYRLSIQHLIQDSLNFYFFLSIIVIISLIILAFLLWRGSDRLWKVASFFILWYFVLLLPLIAVSLVAPYQENRGYLAGVAPMGILAIILEKFRMRWCKEGGLKKGLPYVLVGVLVVLYSGGTIARNVVWKDDFILWSDVVNKYPLSTVGHRELGNYYHKIGSIYSAEMEYRTTLTIDPEEFIALTKLGSLYYKRGDSDRAMEFMQRALVIEPNHMEANHYMAKIHKERGDLLSSSKHLLRMQLFSPHNIRVFEQLVENYANMGKLDYAYRMMSKALEREPHNPGARRALGLIYMYNMQWDNAKREFENVLSYIPNDYNTRIDLARAYEMQGRKDLARKELQKVLIATSKGDLNKYIYQVAQKRLVVLK